jgi:glycosyltransferase involved in cell wall biosynthesis
VSAHEPLPVSVVIPAFNRERELPHALDSVAAQLPRPPSELIVVDDGSTDSTAHVASARGARVVGHETNLGAASARNTGVVAARNEWIALLDSDDAWLPHHLATLWPLRHDRVLVAGAALARPARYAGALGSRPLVLDSPARIVFPENLIPASGVLVRREAIIAAGGFDTSLRYAEDFDLWLRVLEHGTGLAVPRVVYRWNRHEGSKSGHRSGPRETQRRIVASYAAKPWWSPQLAERRAAVAEWDDLRQALREGRRAAAARSALWLLRRRERIAGVARLLGFRRRVRRRTQLEVARGLG